MDATVSEVRALYEAGELSVSAIAARANWSRTTIYKYIKLEDWARSVPLRRGRPKGSKKRGIAVLDFHIYTSYPQGVDTHVGDTMLSLFGNDVTADAKSLALIRRWRLDCPGHTVTMHRARDVTGLVYVPDDPCTVPHLLFVKGVVAAINDSVPRGNERAFLHVVLTINDVERTDCCLTISSEPTCLRRQRDRAERESRCRRTCD